ncbi:serine/threonine-protein kinase mos [Homalodisca vitripennis]|uniref:serine/threonine-protein kinase mos n=1 Tax=Homalodisca vitripennis TaxID=197043 RepID=UPI001EEAFE76|nr:serine/threonine-protein kinase mos [Homalodisca vitripennis]
MCSPAIKNISSFLTPIKSPVIRLSSPLNIDKCSSSHMNKTLPKYLSQQLLSLRRLELRDDREAECCLSVQSSKKRRDTSVNNRVAKCLFSPVRTSKPHEVTQTIRRYQTIPSFDTPQRNSITAGTLRSKTRGFVLGRGSYGVVVKGKYKRELVAVKIIPKIKESKSRQCLDREMNALSLKHPNIIEVHKVIRHSPSDIGFVIMELSDNIDLETLLQCEILPFSIKLRYLKQTGRALEYCHSKGILHLDVKPKNITLCPSNNICKLCDFGSSISTCSAEKSRSNIKGTLKYSAPELLRGKTVTDKTDTYAFGITMWQVINQEVPYGKEDLHVVIYKVVAQNFRPDNHILLCNTPADHIYKACWAANPTERPSMSTVVTMLEGIKTT